MIPTETGERRAGLKAQLLERLHDPLQLRIILIGAVLLMGYGGVYVPLSAQIDAATKTLNHERTMAELALSLEQLQAQCNRFAKRLPQHADSKEWMQYVHEGIRGFPLKLSRLDCLPTKNIGPYQAVVLQIELEGTFFDLDRFLRWLESNPRLLRTDDIDIALAAPPARGAAKGKEAERARRDNMVMKLTVSGLAG